MSSSNTGFKRRPLGPFDLGFVAVFVVYTVAMILPWEHASVAGPLGVVSAETYNGFNLGLPRAAFILMLLGAAYVIMGAVGIPFRRNVSRAFIALIDVGLAGVLAIIGFFVAKSDLAKLKDELPGISVDSNLGTGAYLGLVIGVLAVILAVVVLVAERKAASTVVPPQFATGPAGYVQPQGPDAPWSPPTQQQPYAPPTQPPIQPPTQPQSPPPMQ